MCRSFAEEIGNAGSRTHEYGLRAKQAVERAREQIGADLEKIFDETMGDWEYSGQITPETRLFADLGLESIDIQPGPAYALYLVPGSGRDDPDGGTRLAALRGNRGTQFYDAPPSLDLTTGAWTVLVWCETFDVPVAHTRDGLARVAQSATE